MADVIHMEEVRRAAEKLTRMLEHIHAGEILCTSDIIALSFWLIDFENLESIQPVKRLFSVLTDCLERQTINPAAYREIHAICDRCMTTPASRPTPENVEASRQYRYP